MLKRTSWALFAVVLIVAASAVHANERRGTAPQLIQVLEKAHVNSRAEHLRSQLSSLLAKQQSVDDVIAAAKASIPQLASLAGADLTAPFNVKGSVQIHVSKPTESTSSVDASAVPNVSLGDSSITTSVNGAQVSPASSLAISPAASNADVKNTIDNLNSLGDVQRKISTIIDGIAEKKADVTSSIKQVQDFMNSYDSMRSQVDKQLGLLQGSGSSSPLNAKGLVVEIVSENPVRVDVRDDQTGPYSPPGRLENAVPVPTTNCHPGCGADVAVVAGSVVPPRNAGVEYTDNDLPGTEGGLSVPIIESNGGVPSAGVPANVGPRTIIRHTPDVELTSGHLIVYGSRQISTAPAIASSFTPTNPTHMSPSAPFASTNSPAPIAPLGGDATSTVAPDPSTLVPTPASTTSSDMTTTAPTSTTTTDSTPTPPAVL